ncbi:MAG: hypothetical protein RLZZ282_462 [Verrucomicrobiota bacterium]|jgi:hypothetical protein
MFRLLFTFSLIPLVVALAARWWFAVRVLAVDGPRSCRCNLDGWLPAPGDDSHVHRAEQSAREFGRQLRINALAEWHAQQPKAANAREKSRRFGAAVPPLTGIVVIFAVLVGKVPVFGAFAILLCCVALCAVQGLLALPPELAAITRCVRKVRDARYFSARADEDAIIRCAHAHAWDASLPPVLRGLLP